MRISYRSATAGSSKQYATLADEALGQTADRITAYQPQLRKTPMVEPLIESEAPFVADQGNGRWSVSFGVARVHQDAPTALLFLANHALAFAAVENLDLKIELGREILYLPGCAITEFLPDAHSDRSTFCRYAFVGGSYTKTPP